MKGKDILWIVVSACLLLGLLILFCIDPIRNHATKCPDRKDYNPWNGAAIPSAVSSQLPQMTGLGDETPKYLYLVDPIKFRLFRVQIHID